MSLYCWPSWDALAWFLISPAGPIWGTFGKQSLTQNEFYHLPKLTPLPPLGQQMPLYLIALIAWYFYICSHKSWKNGLSSKPLRLQSIPKIIHRTVTDSPWYYSQFFDTCPFRRPSKPWVMETSGMHHDFLRKPSLSYNSNVVLSTTTCGWYLSQYFVSDITDT